MEDELQAVSELSRRTAGLTMMTRLSTRESIGNPDNVR